jgi:hypothetical protein
MYKVGKNVFADIKSAKEYRAKMFIKYDIELTIVKL